MIYERLIRPLAVRFFGEPLLLNVIVAIYMIEHPDEDFSGIKLCNSDD